MAAKKSWLRSLFSHLWPHAVWDGIHSLLASVGFAAMITLVVGILDKLRHNWDVVVLVVLFIVSVLAFFLASILRQSRSTRTTKTDGTPVPIPGFRTVEEWNELLTHLTPIMNRRFTHEQVVLDGKQFVGCSFVHVNLCYNGTAPFAMQNCDFDDDTKKHFHSQSPSIAQWTELLRMLEVLRDELNMALTPVEPTEPTKWSPPY